MIEMKGNENLVFAEVTENKDGNLSIGEVKPLEPAERGEHEFIYFGIYHGEDVGYEMVKHLVRAVNKGWSYKHDTCALVEQEHPGRSSWVYMDHIDIDVDEDSGKLLLKSCSSWGDQNVEAEDVSAGYVPNSGEACIVREGTCTICAGEGKKDIRMDNDVFSLENLRIYLGEMARGRLFRTVWDCRYSLECSGPKTEPEQGA